MRFQKKYKIFHQQYNNKSIDIPTRILKFHRTKWNFLISKTKQTKRLYFFIYFDKKKKKKIVKFFKQSFFFRKKATLPLQYTKRISLYNSNLQIPIRRWERVKRIYKSSLQLKRHYSQLYDNNILSKVMKKNIFSYKNIQYHLPFLTSVMQFEFRLDILLWRLRFFKNTYQSSLFIDHKFVKVNSKFVKNNYIVKAGDIISFPKYFSSFSNNLKNLKKILLIKNFLEIDYYTNSLIIISDINEMTQLDYSVFMKQYFNLMKFRYFFR